MNQSHISLPPSVKIAIEALERAGFSAYAVGGCVRDSLIGRKPNDWDITTSARPSDTARVFSAYRTVETGIQHGTLTVILDGTPLEITTFRNDGIYADNRHPVQVTFSNRVEDDLARRDFTVNAMAYHPSRGIVDLFDGSKDLEQGVIRCVGDPTTRFEEDGLRILRALRFSATLDFVIDPETASAIHACRHLLCNIAAERVREEFCKLIVGRGAVRILREYPDVISEWIPELGLCVGFDQNCRYHCFDVYEHTLHALEVCDVDPVTRLAVLFHDVGKPACYSEDENGGHFFGHGPRGTEMTAEILKRLRFDNATAASVTKLVEYHDRIIPAEPKAVKRLMQKMSDADILRLMEVQKCDRLAHAKEYAAPPESLSEIPLLMQQIREADECLSLKTLRINGNDLIGLGVPPGKRIGTILESLLDCVIDGTLPNEKSELLRRAATLIQNDLAR